MNYTGETLPSLASILNKPGKENIHQNKNLLALSTSPKIPSLTDIFHGKQQDKNVSNEDEKDLQNSLSYQGIPSLANILERPQTETLFSGPMSLDSKGANEFSTPSLSTLFCKTSKNTKIETDENLACKENAFERPKEMELPTLTELMTSSLNIDNSSKDFFKDFELVKPLQDISLSELAEKHIDKTLLSNGKTFGVKGNKKYGSNSSSPTKCKSLRRARLKCKPSAFSKVVSVQIRKDAHSKNIPKTLQKMISRKEKNNSKNVNLLPACVFLLKRDSGYASLENIFLFNKPSPDDIVIKHQQKAFIRDGKLES